MCQASIYSRSTICGMLTGTMSGYGGASSDCSCLECYVPDNAAALEVARSVPSASGQNVEPMSVASRNVFGISGSSASRYAPPTSGSGNASFWFYARKTRRDQGRKSGIRIQLRTANAALNADGVRAFAVKAETDRPIVLAPCDLGRRERTELESPVGVDVGRQKEGDVLRIFLQAPKVMVHQIETFICGCGTNALPRGNVSQGNLPLRAKSGGGRVPSCLR
ncbi:hypothetical protein OKW45_000586 [Paraburkholderia sp. WSM4175]